jgi:sulfate-transporting ATPase
MERRLWSFPTLRHIDLILARFLDRVAIHILAFDGENQVIWFEGNYAHYEIGRRHRLGAAARSAA